jgi:hypothetical protein
MAKFKDASFSEPASLFDDYATRPATRPTDGVGGDSNRPTLGVKTVAAAMSLSQHTSK